MPVYLLALTVSGVRCFAEPQTLALSHDGRPARGTILLGDNGTGKTTLLQLLAYLQPSPAALSVEFGANALLTAAGYAEFSAVARDFLVAVGDLDESGHTSGADGSARGG